MGGALEGPSSYFMKSPPRQFTDNEARERTLRFIAGGGEARGVATTLIWYGTRSTAWWTACFAAARRACT